MGALPNVDIKSIFFSHITNRQQHLQENNRRIVHYTRAETCLSIIKRKEFWMRNTQCMNDFEEVNFGIKQIVGYFGEEKSEKFWKFLGQMHLGIESEIKNSFDRWLPDLKQHTYITCLSEHLESEDRLGRLSMWRAYGGTSGVAIVINPMVMLTESDALEAYSYPVFYFDKKELLQQFHNFVDSFIEREDEIKSIPRQELIDWIFALFQSYAFCLKHPGFQEEREWRVVYRPNYRESKYIRGEIRAINGLPQKIYKVPLIDIPEEGLIGAELNSLIDHIIIGPCEHPVITCDALIESLREAGVSDPEMKVCYSDIPLRT